MTRRRYAVLGLGQFGRGLALELSRLGLDVLAVDQNPKAVEEIKDKVSGVALVDVRDREALLEVFSTPMDCVVVAIGDQLEAEILATLFLKEMGIPEIVVEAKTPERAEVLQRIGATKVVSPELEFGRRLARRLANPNLLEFVPLTKGTSIIEVAAPSWAVGKSLAELDLRKRTHLAVIAITPPTGDPLLIPGGDARITEGCKLTLVGSDEDVARYRDKL